MKNSPVCGRYFCAGSGHRRRVTDKNLRVRFSVSKKTGGEWKFKNTIVILTAKWA
jgi:hypothetical protein